MTFEDWKPVISSCRRTLGFTGPGDKTLISENDRKPGSACNPLLYGSLFSGIGGLDLGLDRAGMKCEWQVEINEFARKVLTKHWPKVRKHDDIRTFKPTPVDVICGGFPCQDISNAGKQAGIDGERSGLWSEYVRIIRAIRPKVVIVENVAALLVRGHGRVLGDLAESGYDAWWEVLPACAFGAPHFRSRIFYVAARFDSDADSERFGDALFGRSTLSESVGVLPPYVWPWFPEPAILRSSDGIPDRVERNRGCGNAVVPAIGEWLGRRIAESIRPF